MISKKEKKSAILINCKNVIETDNRPLKIPAFSVCISTNLPTVSQSPMIELIYLETNFY